MVDSSDYWIWTLQMASWRYAKALSIPIFDITAKSGMQEFAPRWEHLMAYKHGEMGIEEYARLYNEKLINNLPLTMDKWDSFLQHPSFCIACYCKPGDFCHRYLFSNLLVQYIQQKGKTVSYQGELIPHPSNQEIFERLRHDC